MTLFLLAVVSVLLAMGLALLPPLTGEGIGSVVTRSWLILGMLVFTGHYLHYMEQGRRARLPRATPGSTAHRRSVPARRRSAGYR